ncbi:MAG: dTMP kinase [Alphaproteobacteria bacterium]|nr:dTMP kinase [Alphaproteobacteria bacterium]
MPFITLEGGEGAGKSTQIKLLAQAFEQAGHKTLVTREPGGSKGAEAIRKLVVEGAADRWDPVTESLLFMTARYDHLETLIKPALGRGEWVVCDRFFDSTYIYQGIAKGVDTHWLKQLYTLLYGNAAPELTLLLDIDPKDGLKRASARNSGAETRFENMDFSFHQKLRDGFLRLAKEEPARIHVVDAAVSIEAIHQSILSAVNKRFQLGLKPVKQAA